MILSDSIAVRIDGAEADFTFENDGYRLAVAVPNGFTVGEHAVEIQFQNLYKQSVIGPHFVVTAE